jgi:hypothetical protein
VGERIGGDFDWVAFFPEGVGDDGLLPAVVAEVVTVAVPPAGMPAGSVELRTPTSVERPIINVNENESLPTLPDDLEAPPEELADPPYGVLAIVPASVAHTERVTILRSPLTAPLYAIAYAGPAVPHALVFATRLQQPVTELYVVEGPLDELPTVLSDGSTAGATLVPCVAPGDPIGDPIGDPVPGFGVRCDVIDGQAVLVGANVSLAWVPQLQDAPAFDVIAGGFGNITPIDGFIGGWIFGSNGHALPTCTPSGCTVPGGCSGVRLCIGGAPGRCMIPLADTCDGIDNNCNGLVDEYAALECDDGLSCTNDVCGRDLSGAPACRHNPRGYMCDDPFASCAIGVCTSGDLDAAGNPVRSFSISPTLGDAPTAIPAGVVLPTGCTVWAGHGTCTSGWDSCDCNGPETCNISAPPLPPGGGLVPAAARGCVSAPIAVAGVPIDACDTDGNACTVDGLCCELPSRGWCNNDRRAQMTNPDLYARQRSYCGGGALSFWGSAPGFPNGLVSAVRCGSITGAPPPFNDPAYRARCPADGNPCTNDSATCVFATGACNPPTPASAGGRGIATERIIGPSGLPQAVPQCTGTANAGCETSVCSVDPDGPGLGVSRCMAGARLNPTGVVGPGSDAFATDACTARQLDITCEVPRCIVTAATIDSGGLNRASCVEFGDDRNGADDSRCELPQSCLGGGFCDPTADLGPSFPPRLGCQPPAGMCFVGDGCEFPADPTPGRDTGCRVCNPTLSPWGLSALSDGATCSDNNACTRNDTCASGTCVGICDESLPLCDGECDPD